MVERSVWTSLSVGAPSSELFAVETWPSRKRTTSTPGEFRNLSPAELVEHAIRRGEGQLTDAGALSVRTGVHTGRSPRDKYIVRHGDLADQVWWGSVNQAMSPQSFARLHADIVEHLNQVDRYRMDLAAGADPRFQTQVQLVTESPWSALFARNLFLPGDASRNTGSDDWVILHAPRLLAHPGRHGTRGETVIAIDFEWRRVLIAGTEYAGEIKKSIFTVLQGILPEKGVATMHCSANEGTEGDTALFFGLSGTGKTTLSTDIRRRLIGDDEHGWGDQGIFNFEGGSYAKTIGLSPDAEPQIYQATRRFGTILENVVLDTATRKPIYDDGSLTENTRAAFPLDYLDPAAGGTGQHPANVLFLSADAFGVLPPVARLTRDQALFWFLSGYTSKLAGTEKGVTEPEATYSACFGSPFLPLPPLRYAELFGTRLDRHGADVWLVNTGWTGGPYGVGSRMPIALTRAIVAAILDGSIASAPTAIDPVFGFAVPTEAPGVPSALLSPRSTWTDPIAFDETARKLAVGLAANFDQFSAGVAGNVRSAGPSLT
ncbi:MAG: phosphoenolpyruvate carboxykinase (ATP) [Thermomicrobiales bacterium]